MQRQRRVIDDRVATGSGKAKPGWVLPIRDGPHLVGWDDLVSENLKLKVVEFGLAWDETMFTLSGQCI